MARRQSSATVLAAGAIVALQIVTVSEQARACGSACSQPVSTGARPTASDCLFILRAAVGLALCDPECICRPNGGGLTTTATDALLCLRVSTGQNLALNCACGVPPPPPCTSAEFFAVAGSDLDSGYNGLGHNADIVEGASITLRMLRRCSNDDTICEADVDCSGGRCDLTCNCDGQDSECEITGPTHQRRCLRSLDPCSTNADCAPLERCEHFFGPPLPLSASGTPVCVTTIFASSITGTADAATGEGSVSAFLRSRVHLGETGTSPCPRCGQVNENPVVGDTFTCDFGPNNGQACTVDAVSPDFGGVSFDCPPDAASNASGAGLAIIFDNVTTGTAAKVGGVACAGVLAQQHPSGGNQLSCLDDFSPCTTNADCSRCSNNLQTACDSNADCSGGGICAVAPDQPVTCGIFCHCGYCSGPDRICTGKPKMACTSNSDCTGTGVGSTCQLRDDADKPCFSDADCAPDEVCAAGVTLLRQGAPNGCDAFLCGEKVQDECCPSDDLTCINGGTPKIGECSLASFRQCNSNTDCAGTNSGSCVFGPRPCFDARITRTGIPGPLERVCVDQAGRPDCSTNADCTSGTCTDIAEPVSAGLFCIPPTANDAINSAGGIPGPGAVRFNSFILVCRCGDSEVGCDEQCDDGNCSNGDGCNESCQTEP